MNSFRREEKKTLKKNNNRRGYRGKLYMSRQVSFEYETKDGVVHKGSACFGNTKEKDITWQLIIGQKYRIEPSKINKKIAKSIGRICTLKRFRKYSSGTIRACVEWRDDKRIGYVDPIDLVPAES